MVDDRRGYDYYPSQKKNPQVSAKTKSRLLGEDLSISLGHVPSHGETCHCFMASLL